MTDLYPLRFHPVFRQYIWGGRRLQTELNKPIGDDGVYAESWEVVDHGDDQSVVAFGRLAGKTLHELILTDAKQILGDRVATAINDESIPPSLRNRFPLLVKILDANRDLSVQVHPTDSQAAKIDPPDLGKTEAWIVMATEPGSKIYAGLKPDVTRASFAKAVQESRSEELLHSFEPKVGDCVFIPAGTVHAIGAGILIAEIQQASDTTYRLYDWNRVDDQGNSRPLHIEQGLDVIDFDAGPVMPVQRGDASNHESRTLVDCDKFKIREFTFDDSLTLSNENSFQIITVLQGNLHVEGDPAETPLTHGETMLVPASVSNLRLTCNEPVKLIVATA